MLICHITSDSAIDFSVILPCVFILVHCKFVPSSVHALYLAVLFNCRFV